MTKHSVVYINENILMKKTLLIILDQAYGEKCFGWPADYFNYLILPTPFTRTYFEVKNVNFVGNPYGYDDVDKSQIQ